MPTNIDRHGVADMVEQGAQLVEVLPASEYERAHLPDAMSIPLADLDRDAPQRLERDRPVILYCFDYQ